MKNKTIFWLVGALLLGVLVGVILPTLPGDVETGIVRYALDLPCTAFVTVLRYVAGPLIFLCIVASIYNCGDLLTFGKIGKNALLRFLCLSFLAGVFSVLFSVLFFGLPIEKSNGGQSGWGEIFALFRHFIPDNPWDPFLLCDLLQICFMAIVLGFLLLLFGERVKPAVKVLKKIENFFLKIIELLGKAVPFYVFLSVASLVGGGKAQSALNLWKLLLCYLLISVFVFAFAVIRAVAVTRTPSATLIRNILPPFFVALTTANSTMALDEHFRTAEEKHGVSKTTSRFAVPLAMSIFKPSSVTYLAAIGCYFAAEAGISVSASWIFTAALTTALLTFSIPPIPGGGLNCFTVLFCQLGIPASFLPLALAIDPVVEFPITGVNNLLQPSEIFILETKRKRREERSAPKKAE